MKNDTSDTFRYSWVPVAVYFMVATLLAGCGDLSATSSTVGESGSGMIISGVGTGGTGVVKSALQAQAGDTGLIGAVVFVDKNNNRLPDPDEPSVITNQDGSYTPLQAEAGAPLLIQAIAGRTIIKATGQLVDSTRVSELR